MGSDPQLAMVTLADCHSSLSKSLCLKIFINKTNNGRIHGVVLEDLINQVCEAP